MKKYYLVMLLSAALAAVNVPFSKYLLPQIPVLFMASITYIGGAVGLGILFLVMRLFHKSNSPLLKGKDFLFVAGINLSDSCANIMLFYAISMLNGETASLLQSFEIVTTALLAFSFFKEKIGWRLWTAIAIVVGASVLLCFNPEQAFAFNYGALLIVGTTICWGLANNLAKKLADRDDVEYSFFKCLTPGILIMIIALATGQRSNAWGALALGALDGFLAYGISVAMMMWCFRKLSASLGTALYATNPFIGAIFSLIVIPEVPAWNFYVSIVLLIAGESLAAYDGILNDRTEKKRIAALQAALPNDTSPSPK